METRVIVIVGPTCSGKTLLSLNLALKLQSEVISADSRQVYKYLDIGTAKPTSEQLKLVKHHFVSSFQLDEHFNASKFSDEAEIIVRNLLSNGKIPVVVGGSGLYIKALIDGIIVEVETDEEYRAQLYELRKIKGNEFLYEKLKDIDPESASKMLPQNWKRVIRALEVYHLSGKPLSYFYSKQKTKNEFNYLQFGLEWKRSELYQNINLRVDDMIEHGFVDEVKNILAIGYDKSLNSLNTVGYKEIISFLENKINLEEAVAKIKKNTRNYAKRQLTWFKKDKRIKWISISDIDEIEKISNELLNSI